jgi:hypothetical protein
MSYRMKITLPDPTMTQLEALAEQRGEPAWRIATQMVCAGLAEGKKPPARPRLYLSLAANGDPRLRPPRPLDRARSRRPGMAIRHVGLDRRPLRPLPARAVTPEDGWWEDSSHLETLCPLVVWRLDRPSSGRPAARAGLPRAARRLQPGTSPRGRRRHAGMGAGCATRRVDWPGVVWKFVLRPLRKHGYAWASSRIWRTGWRPKWLAVA